MGICTHKKVTLPDKIGTEDTARYAIVFVHGLGGSPSTWDVFSNMLHDNWSKNKTFALLYPRLYKDNIFVKLFHGIPWLRFFFRIIGGVDIGTSSKSLNSYLESNCYQYDKVIIVGHSMGGLIARKCIVDQLKLSHSTCVNKLITYASPHMGSKIANYLGITLQVRQMRLYTSRFIKSLNKDWNNFSAPLHVEPTYVIAERDNIVSNVSAIAPEENPHEVWDGGQDHFSTINPKRKDQTGFAAFIRILSEFDEDDFENIDETTLGDDYEDEENN